MFFAFFIKFSVLFCFKIFLINLFIKFLLISLFLYKIFLIIKNKINCKKNRAKRLYEDSRISKPCVIGSVGFPGLEALNVAI